MEHIYPGVFEPVSEVIENLVAFPARIRRIKTDPAGSKKTDVLSRPENDLSKRSAELSSLEQSLRERHDAGRIRYLPAERISASPEQPRRVFSEDALYSLAESIREHGILQPLIVRTIASRTWKAETGTERDISGGYELICGERRLRAARMAGLDTVPCIVLEADNRRAAELALIENLQRESLDMFEQAGALAALIDLHAMTQEQLAKSLSVSQSCIANRLRILRLTGEERELILSSGLTERHARAFLRIRNLSLRKVTVRKAAHSGWNVARTEEYIDALLKADAAVPQDGGMETAFTNSETIFPRPVTHAVVKDIGIVCNTIENAVRTIRDTGVLCMSERTEDSGAVRYVITVPR